MTKHDKTPRKKIMTAGWWTMSVMPVVALLLLGLRYGDYLHKIEGLSLFLPTASFYADCMTVPGGLVTWLSALLTQTLYYPWVGAAVYALALLALGCVTVRAFSVRRPLWWYVQIVLAVVLAGLTSLGYLIFTLRPVGYAFSLVVGTLLCTGMVWAYRSLGRWWARALMALVVTTVGYHYAGFYALAAATLCALVSAATRQRLWGVPAAVSLACVVGVPILWFRVIGGHLMPSQIYLSGLPQFYGGEWAMWVVYGGVFAMLAVCAVAPMVAHARWTTRPVAILSSAWTAPVALALCAAGLVAQSYSDPNLRTTLALDRALWDQDWNRAVEIAEDMPERPTRLNTVLADIALMRYGVAGDRMFSIGYGWEPYRTTRDTRPMHDACGALISYHLGLVNYAYRWGMEYSIAQTLSVERLQMLAKCALLNYELPLARTYLELLYNMPMHRDWARRYLHMVSHPMEINRDPEMMAVRQLMCHPNEFVNDGGAFESYVWPLIANENPGTPQFNELSMQAALIMRDLDAFMAKFPAYVQTARRIPRYYQEAALLWSLLTRQQPPAPIDPLVENHHTQFLRAFRQTSGMEPEQQREVMAADYGDTYWFYYVFTEDKPII